MKPPCRASQRWYCVNENGRWRKHKCKSVVVHFRKCACFTEAGLVYKRIPVSNNNLGKTVTGVKTATIYQQRF